jgi:O-succinylbenzoate synthase
VGGLTEVCRIYPLARSYGAKLWAGTMPESGIGSQAAIAAAALPGFVYPSDVEPSTRWFGPDADVISLTMDSQGRMQVPTSSAGFLLNQERFAAAARLLAVTEAR